MPITVQLQSRSYDVHVGAGLLAQLGTITRAALRATTTRAAIFADANVPQAHIDTATKSLAVAGFQALTVELPGGETCKTLDLAEQLLHHLTRTRHERGDPIIAIGGGAVCDLAGFVAATYRRGVPVIQCPTTLLAMVDASVGGKTGVNLVIDGALKKNMVGAFWQPRAVVADTETLRSLPSREFRAGLAECLKHGLVAGDEGLFEWTVANLPAILRLDSASLEELITRNVQVKAGVVAGDEREEADDSAGGRALLNLGHTFGHVIESETDLNHGEAVGLGLIAATVASGDAGLAERVRAAVGAAGLPTLVELPATASLIEMMQDDKKVVGGSMRIVIPIPTAKARVVRDPDVRAVSAGWEAVRKKTTQA